MYLNIQLVHYLISLINQLMVFVIYQNGQKFHQMIQLEIHYQKELKILMMILVVEVVNFIVQIMVQDHHLVQEVFQGLNPEVQVDQRVGLLVDQRVEVYRDQRLEVNHLQEVDHRLEVDHLLEVNLLLVVDLDLEVEVLHHNIKINELIYKIYFNK